VDLTTLRTFSPFDERVFLLGRVPSETTSFDAALRFVHASLRGRHEIDAFLDAPRCIATIVKGCKALLSQRDDIDDAGRRAVNATLTAADTLYATRNRFIHDMLRADLLSDGRELAGLERQPDGEQNITATTFNGMVRRSRRRDLAPPRSRVLHSLRVLERTRNRRRPKTKQSLLS
jgi:hypothetical protein